MSDHDNAPDAPGPGEGARTAAAGTPVPVRLGLDGRARADIAVFLAGPLIWTAHFLLVYTVAEAGCTGDGPGLSAFDPPVPAVLTLAATLVAALACAGAAWWGYRRWRGAAPVRRDQADRAAEEWEPDRSLAFGGFLLSLLALVTVLMVGLPALVLSC